VDEHAPKTLLYPRDPSLDPQLVWQGKDEQDRKALAVPVVPIYIQEKIHPQAIIDALPRQNTGQQQLDLFADFNGIEEFDKKVDFYHHDQHWTNRMILGDSLLVMASLAEKEGLKGKVQTIYLDPPYGIKFGSNWQVSTRKRDVKDGKVEDATRQPEQVKAFRDTWKLGIHSYLAYMRERLIVTQQLLTETGSIFVQINAENAHLVRCLLDEVFGAENFVAEIVVRKKSIPLGAKYLETMHDYILFYAKSIENLKFRHLFEENDVSQIASHGPYAMYPDGSWEKIGLDQFRSSAHPAGTKYYRLFSLLAPSYSAQSDYPFQYQGKTYPPPSRGAWVVNETKLRLLADIDRLQEEGRSLSYRLFYDDFPYKKRTSTWNDAK
jgi:adenine-specific DNA-methyltransferase